MQKLITENGRESDFFVDSCALTNVYLGCQADERMRRAARKFAVEIEHIAKLFEPEYFQEFDYILAVDLSVLELLKKMAPAKKRAKVHLATDFSKRYKGEEIHDPYYGGEKNFDKVMQMAEEICKELYNSLT